MDNIIEINKLNFKDIFLDFNLKILNNKFISIAGQNSCGKTTLIRILNQQYEIENSIKIYDKDLNEIKKDQFYDLIYAVIPNEYVFENETVYEELKMYKENETVIKDIAKQLKFTKILAKKTNNLNIEDKIKIQILIGCLIMPKIILIDCIDDYLNKNDCEEIYKFLKQLTESKNVTIISTLRNLNYALYTDKLMIMEKNNIVIEGTPISIIEKYNLINKCGLDVPFMIDLSVKLQDYDLINEIKYDTKDMVNLLWK